MKKVPKFIWYQEQLYKVIKYYKPTKFDGYLLCIKQLKGSVHSDGETIPIEMILLDIYNDEFYPSTRKIDKMMKNLIKINSDYDEQMYDIEQLLKNSWLDLVRYD